MNKIVTQNRAVLGLALVLAAAFLLRIWGIWFGLPFSFRADEYHEVFRALELGAGGFNFERTGKGGYFYILFVEYGVLFIALKVAGVVASAQDFARYFVSDPTLFYLTGRATTAVIGTVNVFLAYRLGHRAYGVGAAMLAAVFLAVDFLNTEHSHFTTVDVPFTCLATAALLFAVRMVTDGRPSDYKWSALFAALATTTKLPGILLLVPLIVAHYYYVRQQSGDTRQLFFARHLWLAAAIFAVVLIATNPGLVVNPPWELFGIAADSVPVEEELADLPPSVPANLFTYYFFVFVDSMGWPLLIVSLAGAIFALRQRTPTDLILVSYAAVNYVVFASTDSLRYYPRYMLPVIVVLLLLAGRVMHAVWPRGGQIRHLAAILAVAMLVSLPAYRSIANNYLLTQTDTRALAKHWFDENIPQGSKVMIEGLKIEPSGLTVPLRDTVENMREKMALYRTSEPAKAKYLSYLVQIERGKTFDLELVKRSDLQSLDFYKKRGSRYFVIRPEALKYSRKIGSPGLKLIEDLRDDPDMRLLKSFHGDPRSRPGPDIDIYEFRSHAKKPTL